MNKWEKKFAQFISVKFDDIKMFMDEEGTEEQKQIIREMVSRDVRFPAIKSYFYSNIYKPYCKQYEQQSVEYNGHIYLMIITDQHKDGNITHAFKIGETTTNVLTRAQNISATNYFGESNRVNILGYYNINSTKTVRLFLEAVARLALERATTYKFNLSGNDFFSCQYNTSEEIYIYDYVKALFFNAVNAAIKELEIDYEQIKIEDGERNRAQRNVSPTDSNFYEYMLFEEVKMYKLNKWQNEFGV